MSYGVFRLNGHGRNNFILIALFDEPVNVSDDALICDHKGLFGEILTIGDSETLSLPKIPTAEVVSQIIVDDNPKWLLFFPFESTIAASDAEDVIKVGPPKTLESGFVTSDWMGSNATLPAEDELKTFDISYSDITPPKQETIEVCVSDFMEVKIETK